MKLLRIMHTSISVWLECCTYANVCLLIFASGRYRTFPDSSSKSAYVANTKRVKIKKKDITSCAAGLPMAAHMRTRAHTAHAATHKIALWAKPREQEPSFAVAVVCCCCCRCLLLEILYDCWHADVIVDVISNKIYGCYHC